VIEMCQLLVYSKFVNFRC